MRTVMGVETKAAALKLDGSGLPRDEAFWSGVRRLWVSTLRHPWKALVLVPATGGLAARQVARALCVVGVNEGGEPVHFIDGEGVDLGQASRLAAEVSENARQGLRSIIVTGSLGQQASAVPLALASDFAVLGVRLGHTTAEEVERTVDEVGRNKVIGSVLLGTEPWDDDEEDA
jgi:hypothetical protein